YYFTKPHLTSLDDDHINTNIIPPDMVKSPISMPWFPDNVNNHTSPATPPVSGPAWDCPACGSKDNHYSFCPECGTKRPEISEELKPGEWRCICGYVTSSKFCPECGRAKM
ncbi:MAG: hypothetical protein IKO54_00265, partial [Lachnospiraceae bacterium]|nr:hypothetical protein [Lachnospiraceae bacterium]